MIERQELFFQALTVDYIFGFMYNWRVHRRERGRILFFYKICPIMHISTRYIFDIVIRIYCVLNAIHTYLYFTFCDVCIIYIYIYSAKDKIKITHCVCTHFFCVEIVANKFIRTIHKSLLMTSISETKPSSVRYLK